MSSSLRGGERVDRQQAQRRRAVDEHEVEALVERGEVVIERFAQPVLARDLRDELDLGAREVDRARCAQQIRRLRADLDDVSERELVDQDVVDARDVGAVRHPESGRGVSLRIEVDHENAGADGDQARRDIDGGRRLADAALLVRDGQNPGPAGELDFGVLECAATCREIGEFACERGVVEREGCCRLRLVGLFHVKHSPFREPITTPIHSIPASPHSLPPPRHPPHPVV